jgi:DNA methylase
VVARAKAKPSSATAAATSRHAARSVLEGDCVEVLSRMRAESVDAIVTDPPYGIGFQHERWDAQAIRESAARAGQSRLSPSEAYGAWCGSWAAECLRVLKPGAHLLAFGSPRTAHRLATGLEDAGLELRDTLLWLYGTGLPKSRRLPGGRGTALKPAYEPVLLSRRPPDGAVLDTIERHGTGALNIDACRVERRHPANVVLSHAAGCSAEGCDRTAPSGLSTPRQTAAGRAPARGCRPAGCSTAPRPAAASATPAASSCRAASSTCSPKPRGRAYRPRPPGTLTRR